MNRKVIGFVLPVLIFAWSHLAEAQQTKKIPRVALLSPSPVPTFNLEAFQQGLREHGYIEGQNIDIVLRSADDQQERLPELATELARLKVDVIVAVSTPAAKAAMNATKTIPIVVARSGDAVKVGLVESLARPGGNVTGLSYLGPELVGKRMELLKETLPRISNIAVLWNSTNPHEVLLFEALRIAAEESRVTLQSAEVRSPQEFKGAFATTTRAHSDAIVVFENRLNMTYRKLIGELAAKSRLPAIYGEKEFVEAGGLMSYGPSSSDLFHRAAIYVDKILKGAKPAELPVEQPTKFEFVINLKTAKEIGLTIPPNVLYQADKVIR